LRSCWRFCSPIEGAGDFFIRRKEVAESFVLKDAAARLEEIADLLREVGVAEAKAKEL
jgi:hypothetical protein